MIKIMIKGLETGLGNKGISINKKFKNKANLFTLSLRVAIVKKNIWKQASNDFVEGNELKSDGGRLPISVRNVKK